MTVFAAWLNANIAATPTPEDLPPFLQEVIGEATSKVPGGYLAMQYAENRKSLIVGLAVELNRNGALNEDARNALQAYRSIKHLEQRAYEQLVRSLGSLP